MNLRPKVFLSYSHDDRDMANKIAQDLQANGMEVWYDNWEIQAGDSLIDKIFKEGLANADVFIVLISQNSVKSKWVQEELNVAMIKRIEGITRIIPIIVDNAQLPDHLRILKYIDMNKGYNEAIRELQKAIFGIYERPPIGERPDFIRNRQISVGGLSPLASSLGMFFISTGKPESGNEEIFNVKLLSETLKLSHEEIDDAIDELEKYGLVKTYNYLGTGPFSHGDVTPTYALFLHFKDEGLDYNPEDDIKVIACAIEQNREINGKKLSELTELSPLRINRAISYLEDYGFIRVIKFFGTSPYNFGSVLATGETRRFVAEKCK